MILLTNYDQNILMNRLMELVNYLNVDLFPRVSLKFFNYNIIVIWLYKKMYFVCQYLIKSKSGFEKKQYTMIIIAVLIDISQGLNKVWYSDSRLEQQFNYLAIPKYLLQTIISFISKQIFHVRKQSNSFQTYN